MVLPEVPFRAAMLKIAVGIDGKPRYRLQECLLLQKYGWYRGEFMLRPVLWTEFILFLEVFYENTT